MINLKALHARPVALILLCAASACSSPAMPKQTPRPAPNNLDICKGDPIPLGWVISNEVTLGQAGCHGDINNAWHVKIPGNQEVVCLASPIPNGYAVVGKSIHQGCPGPGYNANNIIKI